MKDRMVGVGYSGDQILLLKFVYLILIVNDFVVFAWQAEVPYNNYRQACTKRSHAGIVFTQ